MCVRVFLGNRGFAVHHHCYFSLEFIMVFSWPKKPSPSLCSLVDTRSPVSIVVHFHLFNLFLIFIDAIVVVFLPPPLKLGHFVSAW